MNDTIVFVASIGVTFLLTFKEFLKKKNEKNDQLTNSKEDVESSSKNNENSNIEEGPKCGTVANPPSETADVGARTSRKKNHKKKEQRTSGILPTGVSVDKKEKNDQLITKSTDDVASNSKHNEVSHIEESTEGGTAKTANVGRHISGKENRKIQGVGPTKNIALNIVTEEKTIIGAGSQVDVHVANKAVALVYSVIGVFAGLSWVKSRKRQTLDSQTGEIIEEKQSSGRIKKIDKRSSGVIKKNKVESVFSRHCRLKMEEFEKQLSTIVGLTELKKQLRKWAKGMLLDEIRRSMGRELTPVKMPHMAFLGNPGTGKTTIARLLGNMLQSLGVLSSNKVVEVQRTDLVAGYIGHTGPKTRTKIEEAINGVLFVDEAYRLVMEDSARDFGKEALEEIMSVMEDKNIVIIFAGYPEPMERVLNSNSGLRRRVAHIFQFDNFTCNELAEMCILKMNNDRHIIGKSLLNGFQLDTCCTIDAIREVIEENSTESTRSKMNGGLIDDMLMNAKENLDLRLNLENEGNELFTITLDDLIAGLKCKAPRDEIKATELESSFVIQYQKNMNEFERELSKIEGLSDLKNLLRKLAKGTLMDQKRRAMGKRLKPNKMPHMAFLGNPGTGKTTVARILGKLLHSIGVLSSDKVTEVQKTDLVAGWIGQTGLKTKAKITEAMGGVLFVDEAYTLVKEDNERDFSKEALEEIMRVMEDKNILVIFAGYAESMERAFSLNKGLRRRVAHIFQFDNFTCNNLAEMLILKMTKQVGKNVLQLDASCTIDAIREVIERNSTETMRNEMNGGLIDRMLTSAKENLDLRLDAFAQGDQLFTITLDDLIAGLKSQALSVKQKKDVRLTMYI